MQVLFNLLEIWCFFAILLSRFYLSLSYMDPRSLFFFAILILLSMFFSGSETAFTSLPMHKVNAFKKEKKNWATALYKLKHHSERMLIMILIGNNIVNIAAASLATLISLQIATTIGYHQNLIVTLSTILVTILILLFGEIFPKTFASFGGINVV